MEDNYSKAYKEVIEILKYVPQESVDKIPKRMIETFKAEMDNNYSFIIDTSKNFEEQEILDETKAILANIFRDYWATPYQKERIEAKERYDKQKIEEEKRAKYNPDDIFKNRRKEQNTINPIPINNNVSTNTKVGQNIINQMQTNNNILTNTKAEQNNINQKTTTNNLPIEVKKEKFYQKIIKFFKKIFHIQEK